jgi:two-component system response regulator NreC
MAIRVIVADDNKGFRECLVSLLEKEPGIEVIAEAADGQSAVFLAKEIKPEVAVMDISLPGMNGIEATQRIVSEVPGTKVIVTSMYYDRLFVENMFLLGVSGYVLKDCAFDEIALKL